MRRRTFGVVGVVAVLIAGGSVLAADEPGRIERIDRKADEASTRVIIMLSRPLAFDVHVLDGEAARKSARRLVLDFADTTLGPEAVAPVEVDDGFVQGIRTGTPTPQTARVVLDLARDTKHAVEAYEAPPHVTVTITGMSTANATVQEPQPDPKPEPDVDLAPSSGPTPATPPVLFAPR